MGVKVMNDNGKELSALFDNLARTAKARQVVSLNDYIDDDGLLYCGKCHSPKECKVMVLGKEKILPIDCQCQRKAEEERRVQEQEQKGMEIVRQLKKQSLMDERFYSQTFERFESSVENQRILKLCRRYADGFDEMVKRSQGLLFYGDVGTGKTFAAACIANQLLSKRIPVVMTSFIKLLSDIHSFNVNEEKLIQQLNRAKLLILDDLGAERGSDFALERVYNIVDSRYRINLPMILTTNLDLEDMKKESDVRRSRIYDRIFENCYPVKFVGTSFRKKEANKRFMEMRSFLEG